MSYKQITGYHNLWFWVDEQTDLLDINTSLIMPKQNFALKSGETIYTNSYYETFDKFNELFGLNINSKLCSVGGNTHFSLSFFEDGEEPEVLQEDVQEVVVETAPIVEEKVEVDTSELTTLEVGESETHEVDWEWIESLNNNKEDKLALDQYAEAKFGVKLSRTMKISNMIKVFKEELEAE